MAAPQPPTRLLGPLVVLERVRTRHAEGIHAAIEVSRVELRAFMDWMTDEPRTLEESVAFIELCEKQWTTGEAFNYVMTDPATDEVIGVCGLMTRPGPRRLEIGYWVRSDRAGAGVATAAATLLTEAGFAVAGIDIVEIHHDAANAASGRIPEKLGYLEAVRRDVEIDCPGECGVEVVWEIARAEWLNSPARP
ncbi:MAG: GNAT family N-acetyltransferase [Acidimicrobiales bacterium]